MPVCQNTQQSFLQAHHTKGNGQKPAAIVKGR